MVGRRGARSGRGWDALPPRAANPNTDEPSADGELRSGATGRGNAPGRRRGSPGGPPAANAPTAGAATADEDAAAETKTPAKSSTAKKKATRKSTTRKTTSSASN